jgi:hypothetical protein
MKQKSKTDYWNRQERYNWPGLGKPTKRVCLVCKKAGHLPTVCCNRKTYVLGYILRAPRTIASRSAWKKFEALLWRFGYNKILRIENLALDNQRQM